jgi:hypothetical protein
MEYKILCNENHIELERMVNKLITEGWVLQGGLSATYSENGSYSNRLFVQAMTRIREIE